VVVRSVDRVDTDCVDTELLEERDITSARIGVSEGIKEVCGFRERRVRIGAEFT
jgi:hypothetical protein